ncbi:MAG: hypothetical protein EAZ55_11650 [Cytophagales bacterium]|nr:MAG: hypothetical protein EAZ55_11650 [Cytophagales bacterium]
MYNLRKSIYFDLYYTKKITMKNIILSIIIMLFFSVKFSQAQKTIVITDINNKQAVGKDKVLFIEDKKHNLSLQQFIKIPIHELSITQEEYTQFGITTSAFWLKFKVLNKTQEDILIQINNPLLDTALLYVFEKEKLIHQRNIIARQPEFNLPNSPFSLPNSQDTLTCYLRLTSQVPFLVPINLMTKKEMIDHTFWLSIPDLLFFGAVLVMILYNLFIGIITWSKSYFYYVSYTITLGLTTFFLKGYPVVILGKYHYIINDYFAVLASITSVFLALFTIDFLYLKQASKLGYKLLSVGIALQTIAIIVFLLGYVNLNVILYQVFNLYVNVVIFSISIYLYKRYQPAKLFFWAFLIYLVLSSIVNLTFANIIPFYGIIVLYSLHIGSSIELTLFSIALANKINLYRREKEEAQEENLKLIQEQNTILEQKVVERTQQLQETNEELNITLQVIEQERQKSDKLLLNILPAEVASELKETGKTEVKYFDSVTVLFADVKGFSALATKISPQELIAQLDETFTKMDEISTRFGLERIKTIGDCYMACGGLPHANKTHAFDVILTALNIQHWMNTERARKNGNFWEVRLGIHTGDAVAGVIGKTKFAYDIWGNTVNLASRMESTGEVGKVNVTEATFQAVSTYFEGEYREEIEAKNIGKVKAYFITRLKPEFSQDESGFEPNESFWERYKNL